MNPKTTARAELQSQIAADARALSAESEQIGQLFAGVHDLGRDDFRALLHMMVAEGSGHTADRRPVAAQAGAVRNRDAA